MQQLIYKQDFAPYRNISPNVQAEKLVSPISLAQDIALREILGFNLFEDIFNTVVPNVAGVTGDVTTEIILNTNIPTFLVGQKLRFTGFTGRLAFLNNTYFGAIAVGTNSVTITVDTSLIAKILPAEYEKAILINNYKPIYTPLMVHLIPFLVCVAYGNYILYSDAQITDSGFRSKIDDDSVPVTPQMLALLSNQNKGITESYRTRLLEHLEINYLDYPLYENKVKNSTKNYSSSRAIFPRKKIYKPNYNNN
jgi:hypothetical protein